MTTDLYDSADYRASVRASRRNVWDPPLVDSKRQRQSASCGIFSGLLRHNFISVHCLVVLRIDRKSSALFDS